MDVPWPNPWGGKTSVNKQSSKTMVFEQQVSVICKA